MRGTEGGIKGGESREGIKSEVRRGVGCLVREGEEVNMVLFHLLVVASYW